MDPTFESLKDLTLAIQQVEDFHPLVAALKKLQPTVDADQEAA